jgi:hypothetical protein
MPARPAENRNMAHISLLQLRTLATVVALIDSDAREAQLLAAARVAIKERIQPSD